MADQIKPLKRLGQNFLINKFYAEKIIDSLECESEDILLEIGAGTGALTDILAICKCKQIISLEVDHRLSELLEEKFGTTVRIVTESILDFDIQKLAKTQKIKIVGNIPYNITSDIIFKILDNYRYITRAVLMVQKEVADRLLTEVKTKDYGILTIFAKYHGQIRRIVNINRQNFHPVPNVDSTVVCIDLKSHPQNVLDYELFRKTVRTVFQFRRKMLRNSLRGLLDAEKMQEIKTIILTKRPEELSVLDFVNLSNEIFILKHN